jgi:hypothetical protein
MNVVIVLGLEMICPRRIRFAGMAIAVFDRVEIKVKLERERWGEAALVGVGSLSACVEMSNV